MTRALLLLAMLVAAAPAASGADHAITLPSDAPYAALKAGPGLETTQRNCVPCHSTDYIVMQPRGDLKQWDGVVTKMIKVFGAPIGEGDAKTIADYLAREYGK